MIAATFHGSSYATTYDVNTIAVYPSLEEVIDALFERYTANGQRTITTTYLDGHTENTYWPSVGVGDYFTCYLMSNNFSSPALKEEAILDIHSAVHGGWRDYTVTLDESDQGDLRVIVERAGI